MEITELCHLAEKHLTDKSMKHNRYSYFYNNTINKYLDRKDVKRVCEIGIGHIGCMDHMGVKYSPGASLRMWEEFFPNAIIYGMDIEKSILFNSGRIECFWMDQDSEEIMSKSLSNCGGELDLIVDDGSHQLKHQLNTLKVAKEFLRPGGLLIIEDVRTCHLEYFFAEPPPGFEIVEYNPEDNPVSSFVIYRKLEN